MKLRFSGWSERTTQPRSIADRTKFTTIGSRRRALAQQGSWEGTTNGAQAGEAAITGVLHDAGFGQVRRAAEGPFDMVLEALM